MTANARDNQDLIPIVAPRQSNSRITQISLALSSGRDNQALAATAEMAILVVAVFPSRLSRYRDGFIRRQVLGTSPPSVEYSLTPGRSDDLNKKQL